MGKTDELSSKRYFSSVSADNKSHTSDADTSCRLLNAAAYGSFSVRLPTKVAVDYSQVQDALSKATASLGTRELRFWQQLCVETRKFKILQFYNLSSAENYSSHCHCN